METVFTQIIGMMLFLLGTLAIGTRIRRTPDDATARRTTRTSHLLFWMCLVLPELATFIHPGVTRYDEALGVPPLSARWLTVVVGVPLLAVGLYFVLSSSRTLKKWGRDRGAEWYTTCVVDRGLYGLVRHPMSLGYYLLLVSTGLLAGSTAILLGSLLVVIPLHVFSLVFHEEREAEARLGPAYAEYRSRVPFLVPKRIPRPVP